MSPPEAASAPAPASPPAPAFAVWLTGPPASGKSTITRELAAALAARGVRAAVLESDAMRRILTPSPNYSGEERDAFYGALAELAALLVLQGVPVLVDATANRRAYRERGRRLVTRFAEVWVDAPLEVCAARDPKGLYRRAASGGAAALPGVGVPYEAPQRAEVRVDGATEPPARAAARIVSALEERGWLPCRT